MTYKSSTTLTATAPAHTSAAVVNVYVLTGGRHQPGQPAPTYYAYGAPDRDQGLPQRRPDRRGATVTITGTGFVPGARVEFGDHLRHQRDLQVPDHAHRDRARAHRRRGQRVRAHRRRHQPRQLRRHLHVHPSHGTHSHIHVSRSQAPAARSRAAGPLTALTPSDRFYHLSVRRGDMVTAAS